MFFLSGISISFFLSFLLLTKRNKVIADWILAAWFCIIGIHLLLFYFFINGDALAGNAWLLGIERPLPLVHGPFLFLYAQALTGRVPSRKWVNFIHFVPALASYTYMIQFFALAPAEKIFIYQHKGAGYETFSLINLIAVHASGVIYVIATSLLLRQHRRSILQQFSNTDKINLLWLQYLTYGLTLIWIIVLSRNDVGVFTAVVLFVIFMGYFGTMQIGIFAREVKLPPSLPRDAEPTLEPKKYQKSGLNAESSDLLYQKLMKLVNDEKVYVESELTLIDLAERLGTHPNYLSQVINARTGRNFYDFINYLRVEEFIRLSADPSNQKFTLIALATECGFNSKSSFNRYFKKVTGKTPTDFLSHTGIPSN
jgi:AraC-like DNA-binding protein